MSLEIRKAEARDLPQVKRLFDSCISQDFYSLEALEGMLHREDDLLYVAEDTEQNGRVASCFYAFLATLDDALRILHVREKPETLQQLPGNTRVGVYKTTSTDPAYRNRGLFSTFMRDLQPVLRARGAECIIAAALRPLGREIPILKTLHQTGFVSISTLHSPWSSTKGYCPYCKQDYCICDAGLFLRKFDEKDKEEA